MKILWSALAILVLGGAAALGILFNVEHDPPVDPGWAVQGAEQIPPGAVTVRFTGTSTMLFSDGETDWLIDGWFSPPGPLELAFGKIGPDHDVRLRFWAIIVIKHLFKASIRKCCPHLAWRHRQCPVLALSNQARTIKTSKFRPHVHSRKDGRR